MNAFFQLPADEQAARLTGLARNVLTEWGVTDCEPRLIKFRENAVFEVKDGIGNRAALRVHRQGYHSHVNLLSELKWMEMLAAGGLVAPRPVPANSGQLIVEGSADDVPGIWLVDMLTWLDGKELGEVGEPLDLEGRDAAALFREIGKTMAKMHNLSTAWPVQNAMTRHAWDRDGFVGEEPLWGRFWELAALESAEKDLLLAARAAVADDLQAYGRTEANYGLIHADLVPENVMLDGNGIQLIDFDDAGFGWHMFEIVTALFWLVEEPEYNVMEAALLEGYQAVRSLSNADLDAFPVFVMARALTYVGWVHTRQNTEAAEELTPIVIEVATGVARDYLENRP